MTTGTWSQRLTNYAHGILVWRRYVPDGQRPPRFYGNAWNDWSMRCRVCYPLGINWLAAAVYWVWLKLVVGPRWMFSSVPVKPWELTADDRRVINEFLQKRKDGYGVELMICGTNAMRGLRKEDSPLSPS